MEKNEEMWDSPSQSYVTNDPEGRKGAEEDRIRCGREQGGREKIHEKSQKCLQGAEDFETSFRGEKPLKEILRGNRFWDPVLEEQNAGPWGL